MSFTEYQPIVVEFLAKLGIDAEHVVGVHIDSHTITVDRFDLDERTGKRRRHWYNEDKSEAYLISTVYQLRNPEEGAE